jgi:hypothetical protein
LVLALGDLTILKQPRTSVRSEEILTSLVRVRVRGRGRLGLGLGLGFGSRS